MSARLSAVLIALCLVALPSGVAAELPDDALGSNLAVLWQPTVKASPLAFAPTWADLNPERRYTVMPGDSLWEISRRFGLKMDVIAAANGFRIGAWLTPGAELVIPYANPRGAAVHGPHGPVVSEPATHLVVGIAEQTCWLFQERATVARWPCSTGRPDVASLPGNYTVQSKLERGYNVPSDFWMPHWLGIYDAGTAENGIHGLPYSAETGEITWQDELGTPVTYGCVMLDSPVAEALYQVAYIGMPVTILP